MKNVQDKKNVGVEDPVLVSLLWFLDLSPILCCFSRSFLETLSRTHDSTQELSFISLTLFPWKGVGRGNNPSLLVGMME